ncbi:MAG: endonuclease [Bacteroidetes bacterium]|nr:endonuclease [Bacteroidota bacterium]
MHSETIVIMPEGPSIVILREELSQFKGKKVLHVSGNAKIELERMKGKKVLDMRSWGKHFLMSFDDFFIRIHLLMFGSYRVNEEKEAAPRLKLQFKNGEFSFYTCSVKLIEGNVDDVYDWERDTMSDVWDPEKAYKSLVLEKEELICDSLLDQEIFAGVGNIIKNEVLFLTKVQPASLVKDIPMKKLKEIVKTAREYCFDFLRWKRIFELKKHYRVHTKNVCADCGSKIVLMQKMGKRKRRSFFCPHCQVLYTKE